MPPVHIGQISTRSIKNSIIFIGKPGFEDLPADRQYIINPLPEAANKALWA